jgi:hypothetical protein
VLVVADVLAIHLMHRNDSLTSATTTTLSSRLETSSSSTERLFGILALLVFSISIDEASRREDIGIKR